MNDDIKFCATCKNFVVTKDGIKNTTYYCSRLMIETRPNWKFNCWDGRDEYIEDKGRDNI